jgi:hypothetical protein
MEANDQLLIPAALTLEKEFRGTSRIGCSVGSRADLDAATKKSPFLYLLGIETLSSS